MKKSIFLFLIVLLFLSTSINAYADDIVYVTKTGSCYHIQGCSYLKSAIPISLEDAKEIGYQPCSRCKPNENLGERYTTKNNVATNKTKSVPKEEPTPNTNTVQKHDTKQVSENDNDFWGNAFYFAVGGCVMYGISKKKREN